MRVSKSLFTILFFCLIFVPICIGTTPLYGSSNTIHVKGLYTINSSIQNLVIICDSVTKIIVSGNNVVIEDCTFDANGYSVDRCFIELIGEDVTLKNCTIKNVRGKEGKGAYGIYVDIEKCSATILSCKFTNISDSREETDPVGQMKGMCGAIYYSCDRSYLKSSPRKQIIDDVEIESIFTSLPDGTINDKSFDADGIRVFINDKKTPQALLNAQEYEFRGIKGRDIQKRLIKISGGANCVVSNVFYKRNKKLPRRYPSHLIAVYDSEKIKLTDVDYSSGCNDIVFCGSNSTNVSLENLTVKDNSRLFRKSTSSLFRINNCKQLHIKGLRFSGQYYRLGQLNNSQDVDIQIEGKKVSCASSIEIKNTNGVKLAGSVQGVKNGSSSVFSLNNVNGVSIREELGGIDNPKLFKLKDCSGIVVER